MHNFPSNNLNMPTCYKPIVTITKKDGQKKPNKKKKIHYLVIGWAQKRIRTQTQTMSATRHIHYSCRQTVPATDAWFECTKPNYDIQHCVEAKKNEGNEAKAEEMAICIRHT